MTTITTGIEPRGDLRDAADVLLDAAMEYWHAYHRAGLRGAVVWVSDTDGRLVVLTRGEYRGQIMRNVEDLLHETPHLFEADRKHEGEQG